MAHNCSICRKEMTKEEYRSSIDVGSSYHICPDCKKIIDVRDTSIPKFEKVKTLLVAAKQYDGEFFFKNYLEERIKLIENSMSEEERQQMKEIQNRANKALLDEKRTESAESFEKEINTGIVLVTTDFISGHTIKHMLGPVSGCSAVGAGMLKSYFASWSAALGTNSNSLSEKISSTRHEAEKAMLQEAKALGANAVIDVHYAISNFTADLTGVLVTGTAVVIE